MFKLTKTTRKASYKSFMYNKNKTSKDIEKEAQLERGVLKIDNFLKRGIQKID